MPARSTVTGLLFAFLPLLALDAAAARRPCNRFFQAEYEEGFSGEWEKIIRSKPKIYSLGYTGAALPFVSSDPFLTFARSLGFSLSEPVRVPPLSKVLRAIDSRRRGLLKQGFSEEDLFAYARAFKTADGTIVPIKAGEKPPPGSKPLTGPMTPEDYFGFLIKGLQPLGENFQTEADFNGAGYTTVLGHDLVHLYIFTEHPLYARALRRGLKSLRDGGVKSLSDHGSALSGRFAAVTEILELPDPRYHDRVRELVEVPRRPAGHVYSVSEVEAHLRSVIGKGNRAKTEEFKENLRELARNYGKYIISYGGSAADPGFRYRAGHFPGYLLERLFVAVAGHWPLKDLEDTWHEDSPPFRNLAELYTDLMNFMLISAEEWVEQSLVPTIDRDSMVYRILCESGSRQAARVAGFPYCRDTDFDVW